MSESIDPDRFPSSPTAPFPLDDDIWVHPPVPRTGETIDSHGKRTPPGLPMPGADHLFALAPWAQYIAHYGRPGIQNHFVGVAMDYAHNIFYPSVFGYLLGRNLSPADTHA